jgi:general nucleoside transport system permease protein
VIVASALRSFEGLLSGSVSATTPILLAALGGMYTYYAGIFNIAMEAMLLAGAFGGVVVGHGTGSWAFGVVGAMGGAGVLAVLFGVFVLGLKTDEFVTGIALNLATVGATTFLLRRIYKKAGAFSGTADRPIPAIPKVRIPGLADLPVVRSIAAGHTLIEWAVPLLVFGSILLVFRTPFGLRLRSAGWNAACLDASGVSTVRIRIISLALCAGLCGLGGAFLSLGYLQLFGENMSNGRGWIALAAIVLVSGSPLGIAVLCLLFGFASSLGLKAQGISVPSQFTDMLPYVATLVALYLYARRRRRGAAPSARAA